MVGPTASAVATSPAGIITLTGVSVLVVVPLRSRWEPDPDRDAAAARGAVAKLPEPVVAPGQHVAGRGEREAVEPADRYGDHLDSAGQFHPDWNVALPPLAFWFVPAVIGAPIIIKAVLVARNRSPQQ